MVHLTRQEEIHTCYIEGNKHAHTHICKVLCTTKSFCSQFLRMAGTFCRGTFAQLGNSMAQNIQLPDHIY